METKRVRIGKSKLKSITLHLKNGRSHISELQELKRRLKKLLNDRSLRDGAVIKLKHELRYVVDLIKKDYSSLKSSRVRYFKKKMRVLERKVKNVLLSRSKA